jgi:hypothetical protein
MGAESRSDQSDKVVHGYIKTAMGDISDGDSMAALVTLTAAVEVAKDIEAERDCWRETAHEMERARNVLYEYSERLRQSATDASQTVICVIVMLAGLTEPWDGLDYPERCARAENELRALDDRLATDETLVDRNEGS